MCKIKKTYQVSKALEKGQLILDKKFGEGSVESKEEASYLLSLILDISLMEVRLKKNDLSISRKEYRKFLSFCQRRVAGQPAQYLTGKAFFMRDEFLVGPGVLIPRQDTQHLVLAGYEYFLETRAKKRYEKHKENHAGQQDFVGNFEKDKGNYEKSKDNYENDKSFSFLEFCTGSACVSISLIKEIVEYNSKFSAYPSTFSTSSTPDNPNTPSAPNTFDTPSTPSIPNASSILNASRPSNTFNTPSTPSTPSDFSSPNISFRAKKDPDMVWGLATDISRRALQYARENIKKLGVQDFLVLKKHDFLKDSYKKLSSDKYDLILMNPPYIRREELDGLQVEVRKFEPRGALDGGEDGLVFYQRISQACRELLKEGGLLAMEIGYDQAKQVQEILSKEEIWEDLKLIEDFEKRPRVITAVYRP